MKILSFLQFPFFILQRPIKKILVVAISVAAIFAAALVLYFNYVSPTKVALVNYRDFQAAKFIHAENVGWVTVDQFNDSDYSTLKNYDFVLIFGRGLRLNDQQLEQLKVASERSYVLVDSAMNPAHAINSFPKEHRQSVSSYLDNSGSKNYTNLLRYFRANIDNKRFNVVAPEAAFEVADNALFHKDPEAIFSELNRYQAYYETLPSYNKDGQKIALITSVPGPFNANRDHVDQLITRLEQQGYRVYPIASATRRLDFMKAIQPDAVIMMPHGRLHVGNSQEAIAWLKQQNIPLLSPLSVFEEYTDWLTDLQGYSGALLSMNVVLPELDGAVSPYVINAQFSDETGLSVFKIIPNRLERFITLLDDFLALKSKPVAQKKVAIVYFRGPGKNALVAGNMEVAPSLFHTLQTLKAQGYDVSGLPDNFVDFKAELDRQGVVMTPIAQGQNEQFLQQGNPAFIDADSYRSWCKSLEQNRCEKVESIYGEAPGNFLINEKGIAVARLQYGNVVVLPQPLPGLGDDTFKLVHGTDKAPPHTYLAAYHWLRDIFKADAVMHYGTHGSLEFTPKKQVALSEADWADALLGGIPHFYLYTMSNVGEAIIAKRRSYATIINHLTPPFNRAGLSSELKQLQDLLQEYSLSDGAVRDAVREQIIQSVQSLSLDEDLQLTEENLITRDNWDDVVLRPVSSWLETIAAETITDGLYTLGKTYTPQQTARTLQLMFSETLAYHYQTIANLSETMQGNALPDSQWRSEWLEERLSGISVEHILQQTLGENRLADINNWVMANPSMSDMDIVRGFIALGEKKSSTQSRGYAQATEDELQSLVVAVLADAEAKSFVLSLKNEQTFSHVSRVLDPEAVSKAKALAVVIPAIKTALTQLEKPPVKQLVQAMQTEVVREQVIGWIESDSFTDDVKQARENQIALLTKAAIKELPLILDKLAMQDFSLVSWQQQRTILESIKAFDQQYLQQDAVAQQLGSVLQEKNSESLAAFKERLQSVTASFQTIHSELNAQYAELAAAVDAIRSLLTIVPDSLTYIRDGDIYETNAIANALAGGYVAPASGGDPILNPMALPTGRNMYSIDAEKTPSQAAWKVGVSLAEELLANHQKAHGEYPKKVAFTLWPSSFIHSQGATVAEILFLLGIEPVRDPFGRIQTLRLIPADKLGRPRIDVVVQSAGQLRDLAASRLALIEEAVALAAGADDGDNNFVSDGVRLAEKYLLDQGVAPLSAKTLATRRSFGGVNNNYGTGIMGLVESSNQWQDQQAIADQYIKNMGAVYGDSESWGEYHQHLFTAALQNTEVIVQPRSSNTWGALSLDHVYEFMGGLNAAATAVTGVTPDAYFNDYRNSAKAKVSRLEETIALEARTTLLNPTFIQGLTKEGGASSAETFAETFRNTFGWDAMRPEAIDSTLWEQLYEVYVDDKFQLALYDFFEQQNPYALQEMTGVMLEASRKGFWQASPEQLQAVAALHAQLVADYEAGCGSFTCGNMDLQAYIRQQLTVELREQFQQAIDQAQRVAEPEKAVVLVEKTQREIQAQEQRTATEAESKENNPEASSEAPADTSSDLTQYLPLMLLILISLLMVGWLLWRRRVNH